VGINYNEFAIVITPDEFSEENYELYIWTDTGWVYFGNYFENFPDF
jgi:hypothetical protein